MAVTFGGGLGLHPSQTFGLFLGLHPSKTFGLFLNSFYFRVHDIHIIQLGITAVDLSLCFHFQTFALVCQLLLFFFGMKHSFQMSGGGMTYFIFMTTSSGCLLNSLVLIASYVLSPRTIALIRPTLFVSTIQRR